MGVQVGFAVDPVANFLAVAELTSFSVPGWKSFVRLVELASAEFDLAVELESAEFDLAVALAFAEFDLAVALAFAELNLEVEFVPDA